MLESQPGVILCRMDQRGVDWRANEAPMCKQSGRLGVSVMCGARRPGWAGRWAGRAAAWLPATNEEPMIAPRPKRAGLRRFAQPARRRTGTQSQKTS
jgi:hypothetical protein